MCSVLGILIFELVSSASFLLTLFFLVLSGDPVKLPSSCLVRGPPRLFLIDPLIFPPRSLINASYNLILSLDARTVPRTNIQRLCVSTVNSLERRNALATAASADSHPPPPIASFLAVPYLHRRRLQTTLSPAPLALSCPYPCPRTNIRNT
ncbi:uncharacterized protein BDV17DRAFT_8348 [Aspergillus undulatus]|uniref:uncharacterized protein n=1 Tax=Aspergillus undulatus TaxID=1810928 RepID=UPI003CCDA3C2